MKRLTLDEFKDRTLALQRAERIFIFNNLTENNLTTAFRAYQEILAEQDRDIFLNTINHGDRHPTVLDLYKRPTCPDCNKELFLRRIVDEAGKPLVGKRNTLEWRTSWLCRDNECAYESFHKETIEQWMDKLPRRES